jgi:signal transduction histidine kinase
MSSTEAQRLDPATWGAIPGVAICLGLSLAAATLWRVLPSEGARSTFEFAFPALLTLGMAAGAFRRGRAPGPDALGWNILGITNVAMGSGWLVRLAVHLNLAPGGTPASLGLMLQLMGGFAQVVALLAWPLAPTSHHQRTRRALDALVFAQALFFILWILGWGDIHSRAPGSPALKLITLAFPVSSILVLAVALYSGTDAPAAVFRGPVGWLAASFGFAFLGNLAWALATLKGYDVDHNFALDTCFFLIPLLKLMAPLSPHPVGPGAGEPRESGWTATVLPYLPVGPALVLAVITLVRAPGSWNPVLSWIGMGMMVTLLARQFLAIRDLHRFSVTLEEKVAARTRTLEENQSLMLRTQRMNTLASMGAGLAHDLNNLLGASMNYLELAEEDLRDGGVPKARDLAQAKDALARAAALTHRLLAYGREEEPTQRFDLGERTRNAEPLLRVLLPRSIRLEIETVIEPLPLEGHPAQVDQILVNLVANARDAMPEGGRITLRTGHLGSGMACLEVEDTGHGMTAEVQAKVFEAFYTTKAPGRGTGLGLASVRTLVAQAGGEIRLWSEPGRGTRFTLLMPLAG